MNNRHVRDKALKIFIPIELFFIKTIVILACLLLLSQVLLLNPITRQYVSKIDKLEGNTMTTLEAVPASQVAENQQWIELLLLEELPRAEINVYIEGIKFASFNELQMKIPIYNKQTLSITVQGIPGIYSVQILDVSDDINIELLPGKVLQVSENTPLNIEL